MLRLQLLSQVEVLVAQPLALEGVADDEADFVQLERLGDVVVGAQLHRLDRGLRGGDGGDDDHGHVRGDLLGRAQHLQPVHLGHAQVGDDGVRGVATEGLDGSLAARGGEDVIAFLLEGDGEEVPHALLIIDHEHAGLGHGGSMLHRAVRGRKR